MAYDDPLVPIPLELPDLSTNPQWDPVKVKEYFTLINAWAALTGTSVDQLVTWLTGFGTWAEFTPEWTAPGTVKPTIGNGILKCRYRRVGPNLIFLRFQLVFGSTTAGGYGGYTFTIPDSVPILASANMGEQVLQGTVVTNGGVRWDMGMMFGFSSNKREFTPIAPNGQTDAWQNFVRHRDTAGNSGSGIPLRPGLDTFTVGSTLTASGLLEIQ